jgi:predicted DNA binding CopG/RHH family protein
MAETTIKTTLRVEESLWRRARIRALEKGIPVQDLVTAALEAYLKAKPGRKESGR